jgi:glycosyltransferase involved in cell wall biosynthesis
MLVDNNWSDDVRDIFSNVFGAPPSRPLAAPYRKVTPKLSDLVENLAEVLNALRGSAFRTIVEAALHKEEEQESGHALARPNRDCAEDTKTFVEGEATRTVLRGPAVVISREPFILSTPTVWTEPLGLPLGEMCPERKLVLLVSLTAHFNDEEIEAKATAAREYQAKFPKHEVIFLTNTPQQAEVFQRAGADAFFANQSIFVSEEVFRPLPDVPTVFDAVYDARPVPFKRHELAAEVERIAYVSFAGPTASAEEREIVASLLARPGHVLINELVGGIPRWMPQAKVNEVFAQADVGLCLSEREGAMYASIEYMLAGLPVVSTPSEGGRDVFFDPDYCLIVEPTPRAVREGVEALRARNIPRSYVRARTLARLTVDRHRFLAFLGEIKARYGCPRSYDLTWTFSGAPFHKYKSLQEHARDIFGVT